jgi:hypothetical protein
MTLWGPGEFSWAVWAPAHAAPLPHAEPSPRSLRHAMQVRVRPTMAALPCRQDRQNLAKPSGEQQSGGGGCRIGLG